MGDSGSQVIGFALGSLGLAATLQGRRDDARDPRPAAARARRADPRHGARDACSACSRAGRSRRAGAITPRTGSSTAASRRSGAVLLLTAIATGLGATSLAYIVLDNGRITAVGVLLSFALLLQFGSFLADAQQADDAALSALARAPATARRGDRRLRADHGVVLRRLPRRRDGQRHDQPAPRLHRHAADPARRALPHLRPVRALPLRLALRGRARRRARLAAVVVSEALAFGFLAATRDFGDFPTSIFVIDALLCALLVGAARFGERAFVAPRRRHRGRSGQRRRADRRRRAQRAAACCASCARRRTSTSSASSTTTRGSAAGGSTASGSLGPSSVSRPTHRRRPSPTPCSSRSPTRRRSGWRRSPTRASRRASRAGSCGASSRFAPGARRGSLR